MTDIQRFIPAQEAYNFVQVLKGPKNFEYEIVFGRSDADLQEGSPFGRFKKDVTIDVLKKILPLLFSGSPEFKILETTDQQNDSKYSLMITIDMPPVTVQERVIVGYCMF